MGKKKPAVKAAPPASTPAKEDFAIHVLCVQQHQPELYEAIMVQGRKQAYNLVKAMIARTLEKGRASIFEEGREEGLAHGRNDVLMEIASMRDVISVPAASATQTTCEMADFSTQTTCTSTVDTVTQTAPLEDTPTHLLLSPPPAVSPLMTPTQPP
jgi:hypothetical protein